MTVGTQHPLAGAVLSVGLDAAEAVRRLGEPSTRDSQADLIRAETARVNGGTANVVVVGEKKRGKSSLINALVGVPGLLPVEVDVATSVHLVVRHAPTPQAQAHLLDQSEPQPITLAQLAEYAALDPLTQEPYRDDVRHVEVGVPSPLLDQGLALVDTPGVGGLVSGHAQITLATLERADALLFVVNGSTELTRSELAFLQQATERIATVFFVLTQIDKYPSWRDILTRDQELLREHAPRYREAPWFAVSSQMKSDADEAAGRGDADKAQRRLAGSGFTPLLDALTHEVAEQAGQLRLRNALHVVHTAIDPLVLSYERRLRSLSQDPSLVEEVRDAEAALARLQDEDATWRKTLDTRMRELEGVLQLGFRRCVNDLKALADEKINTSSAEALKDLPADLDNGVRGVWMQLENATREGMARVSAELGGQFRQGGEIELAAVLELPERIQRLPGVVYQARDDVGILAGLERIAPTWGTGVVTFGLLTIASGGALLFPAAVGFGIMAGLAHRRKKRDELLRLRGDANRYVAQVVNELLTEVPPHIKSAVSRGADEFAQAIGAALEQRRHELQAELVQAKRDLAAAREELAARREQAMAESQELAAIKRRADELDRSLSTAPRPAR